MSRIVDLSLPVTSNMAGIPKIEFYEQYPTRIQAVTVVSEEQRAMLHAEGVDCLPDAPVGNSMNTVITLTPHTATLFGAPRPFLPDGPPVSAPALARVVMREAIVTDVSHKAPGE